MPRVVVLGSSGFDLTIRLPRLPKPGETLLGGHLHTGAGGKGANQAIGAKRAGAEVLFLTAFGEDDFGRRAADNTRSEGIDLTHSKTIPKTANQVALIFVGEGGENLIGVAPGASAAFTPEDIQNLPDDVFRRDDVFLASLEVPVETVRAALQRARHAGMTTIVNPAPANRRASEPEFLCLVDVLTPNEEEAFVLSEVDDRGMEGVRHAAHSLRRAGVRDVIVTLGEHGCLVVNEHDTCRIAAPRVDVVDTVGAGDAFSAALAVALAEGQSLLEAASWATIAGSFAVTKQGAQGALPNRDQIEELARKP